MDRVKRPKLRSFSSGVESHEVFSSFTSLSSALHTKLSRTSYRQLLKSPNATKAELEKSLRDQWASILVELVMEVQLPVTEVAAKTVDPVQTILRAIGNRRAKTLRNRARAWIKFRDWLTLLRGRNYPEDLSDLIDYLWYHTQEGANKSLVQSIAAALSVIEDIGMVPASERFSQNSLWLRTCKSYIAEFEEFGSQVRVAPPLTVAMLVSLEMEICDESQSLYARALCWIILVAVWACMRVSDLEGIDIRRMRLVDAGLTGVLTRTKTTGPGKRVQEVQFFVKRNVSLTANDWLAIGWSIWVTYNDAHPRDFFLMKSNRDWTEPVPRYLKSETMAVYVRSMFALLRIPKRKRYGGLQRDDTDKLLCQDSLMYFTGHSMRHTLPTISAMMGCDKQDRDYLGRWHIPMHSQQYVNNSRQAVHRIQETVCKGLCTGSPSFDPGETLQDLREFVDRRGGNGAGAFTKHSILRQVLQLEHGQARWELGMRWPTFDPTIDGELVDEPDKSLDDETSDIETDDGLPQYFITISRKTGFRRLHLRDGCGLDWRTCHRVEFLDKISKTCADSVCASCKKRGNLGTGEEEETSSSGSSTSTQAD